MNEGQFFDWLHGVADTVIRVEEVKPWSETVQQFKEAKQADNTAKEAAKGPCDWSLYVPKGKVS